MNTAFQIDRALLEALLPLLSYPDQGAAMLPSDDSPARANPSVQAALLAFAEAQAGRAPHEWEEEYTRAFDLSPMAIPYVSIHLYGEESYKRGRLMAWLNEQYAERGFDAGAELPDHVGNVIRFLLTLDEGEAEELAEFCLRGPIAWMQEKLAAGGSPYQYVLQALQVVIGQPRLVDGAPVAPSWESVKASQLAGLPGFDNRPQWEQEFGRE